MEKGQGTKRKLTSTSKEGDEVVQVHVPIQVPIEARMKVLYSIVPCEKRLSVLISFLRRNTSGKTVLLFDTWYAADYHAEVLKRFGLETHACHGTDSGHQKHSQFGNFRKSVNKAAILCATNIPKVDRVPRSVSCIIQCDPPRGIDDFLRCKFGRDPRNLLFLRPQEKSFLVLLEDAEVAPTLFDMSEDLKQPPIPNSVVGGSFRLTRLAHRAYSGYMHTYRKHKLQQIFDPDRLLPEVVAPCFGLSVPPTADDLAACRTKQELGGGKRIW